MRVTNEIGNVQQAAHAAATKPVANDEAKRSDAAPALSQRSDHAEVSAAGSLISKALDGSDVRMDKVQALQQAIASGSYQVSSSDVADKMMDSMMEQ